MVEMAKCRDYLGGAQISWPSGGCLRVETSSYAGAIKESLRGFDTSLCFKRLLSELFGNENVDVETEVRNDNSCVVAHVRSINSVAKERSLGGLPETSREAIELSDRLTL